MSGFQPTCGRLFAAGFVLSSVIAGFASTAAAGAPVYLTTQSGGKYGGGAVLEYDGGSSPAVIYSFCAARDTQGYCEDGERPLSVVVMPDGSLAGVAERGGKANVGTFWTLAPSVGGRIFRKEFDACWYWMHCARMGHFLGPLIPAGLRHGYQSYEGLVGDGHGNGLLYSFMPETKVGSAQVDVVRHWMGNR